MFEILERFSLWCRRKVTLHVAAKEPPLFKQGEVWWCSIGMNVGDELFGKGEKFSRPVLVLKKFSRNTFLGLPMTLQEKNGSWFVETQLRGVRRWVILSQARTMDAKRLDKRIGSFEKIILDYIREQFIKLIGS